MAMSVSVKKATGKTNIKHNNREMNEREKKRNAHINYARSNENKYLIQDNIRDLYNREFASSLEKYNEKQTRFDRKIKDYYKHIEASKKTSTQQEMIIQIGDKDDFSSKENRQLANAILEGWYRDFEKRNPNLKVYNAVIHNDEFSPHMHLNFVPVASGYKRGLEKQVSFDRAIKQQDDTLDKKRPFDDWREKEVGLLEEMLNERGIERKMVGTNEYRDVNDYKAKKDLEREINDLKQMLPEKEDLPIFEKERKLVKTSLFKTEEQETGNYVVSAEEYNNITEQIRAAQVLEKENHNLKKTVKQFEDNYFERYYLDTGLMMQIDQLKDENKELKRENKGLRSELAKITALKDELMVNVQILYKSTKNVFKDKFKDFRAMISRRTKENDVTDVFREFHKEEVKQEAKQEKSKSRGMEL